VINYKETKYSKQIYYKYIYRLNFELAKGKETSTSKIESLELRIKTLERALEERDRAH
jgi:hypothetical protein